MALVSSQKEAFSLGNQKPHILLLIKLIANKQA
jgi:hypothetical protein